ncbi:hypothetical protein B7463_g8719, partial [Scytalidium lignicola]
MPLIERRPLSVCIVIAGIALIYFKYYKKPVAGNLKQQIDASDDGYVKSLKPIRKPHPTQACLEQLLEKEGAGSWPPRTSYGESWPKALRPYHEIYLALAPLLPCKDDEISFERCLNYRAQMRGLLRDRVQLADVEALLCAAEQENKSILPGEAWNGFYSCIASLRHAFRWGTIPVVQLAQAEKVIDIPSELEVPWAHLQRRFGVTSQGGNVLSNFLCNFNANSQIVYPINTGMPEIIRSAEYGFAHIFLAVEAQALPMYYLVVKSFHQHSVRDRSGLLESLGQINIIVQRSLKIYYDTMVDMKISKTVWMRYVQGFQAWSAGTINATTGEYTQYDGLSGNQLLFFNIIDAFLGLDSYLTEENMLRYMPETQRRFINSVREHSFREKGEKVVDGEVEDMLQNILKQIRVFRTAHRVRVKPYLGAPAPERLFMTAGKGVLGETNAALTNLDKILEKRLHETR